MRYPRTPRNVNGGGYTPGVSRRRIVHESTLPRLQDSFREAKLNYRGGKPSKHRATLHQLGGTADAHYRNQIEFWQLREYVRDWDRNTPILGQAVDRGLDQILGAGLRVDPQTGDEALNESLLFDWLEWSEDPEQCDFTARFTFDQLERLGLRHEWIDGDAFGLLDDASGSVRLEEGDRVDSSSAELTVRSKETGEIVGEVVHGVELDLNTRPVAYHFIRLEPGERQRQRRIAPAINSDRLVRVPRNQVIHLFSPKRVSQNRGITAFAPVFDRVGMGEDIEFAQLVQQQVAACIAAFVTSEFNQQWGSRTEETGNDDETNLNFDEFSPGMVVRLRPGEKVEPFSPRNPTGDAREQAKQITREIGLAIGLPLELSLLVTSDTTFHGYRGVIEAYKKTAKRIQKWYARKWRSRVYRWKVAQWVEEKRYPDLPTIARHAIHCPAWQYVDPETEAKADTIRQAEHLASPRQIWAERGRDLDQGIKEIVEDRGKLISAAQETAKKLSGEGDEVTWRDVLAMEPAPVAVPESGEKGEGNEPAE